LVRGLFVQAVDWHDWEEVMDGPGIGKRLEDGEVAVVGIAEQMFQTAQVFGDVF